MTVYPYPLLHSFLYPFAFAFTFAFPFPFHEQLFLAHFASLVKFFNLAICYGTLAVLHIETGHGTLAWSLLCATCCCNITASSCLNSCRIFMQDNVVDSKKMPQRDGKREKRRQHMCKWERGRERKRGREREGFMCVYLWQVSFISIRKSPRNPQIYLSTLDNFIVDAAARRVLVTLATTWGTNHDLSPGLGQCSCIVVVGLVKTMGKFNNDLSQSQIFAH